MAMVTENAESSSSDEPPMVTTQELGDEISRQAGHLTAATCRWLLLRVDADGCIIITTRLPPQDGAAVLDMLEDLVRADHLEPQVADEDADEKQHPADVSAETRERPHAPDP